MITDGVGLQGEGIVLREWAEADLPQMTSLFDDPEVAYRTPIVTPFNRHTAREYLNAVYQAKADGSRLHLAITVDDDLARGEVMLNHATASIAYVVGAEYRGQGLATRAVTLLTRYAHDIAGLPRAYLEIEADNAGSVSVARGAGFLTVDDAPEFVEDKGRRYALHRWVHQD